ncbi:MAG: Rho-binding antiterminator [Pseudomonadota bacterium]
MDSSTPYSPIDCNLYDYIEIACLYRYSLRIATVSGEILTGTAVDTEIDSDKAEYLKLQNGNSVRRVRLDYLHSIEPLTQNARFGKVDFTA